jgi:hypothetical protein
MLGKLPRNGIGCQALNRWTLEMQVLVRILPTLRAPGLITDPGFYVVATSLLISLTLALINLVEHPRPCLLLRGQSLMYKANCEKTNY